jgi:hypothetical protein
MGHSGWFTGRSFAGQVGFAFATPPGHLASGAGSAIRGAVESATVSGSHESGTAARTNWPGHIPANAERMGTSVRFIGCLIAERWVEFVRWAHRFPGEPGQLSLSGLGAGDCTDLAEQPECVAVNPLFNELAIGDPAEELSVHVDRLAGGRGALQLSAAA